MDLAMFSQGFFVFFCLFLFWTLPGPHAAVASAAISDPECRRAGLVGPRGRRSARDLPAPLAAVSDVTLSVTSQPSRD